MIDQDGNQVGVVSKLEAVNKAILVGLDLVEISPNSNPPVCKILDFGKFKYEKQKQDKLNKKNQHVINVKEIRIRPNTDQHDLVTKLNKGQKFLRKGDKLKITVMFRGRELGRTDLGMALLDKVVEILAQVSIVDQKPSIEGRRLSVILSPKAGV